MTTTNGTRRNRQPGYQTSCARTVVDVLVDQEAYGKALLGVEEPITPLVQRLARGAYLASTDTYP
ncbi:hypothetical protein [Capillimicrobium parvum]|uniref:Uncharacterized protein n=1 Tax=Capillimicrobium parvum TaxID=2884022 RepID=A0A9E6XVC6_9ACTN|nr:hypothetical protein [Capillimicrobium parvum]UGS35139.1 hypothetical protein DSM104329_01524 [Capillimicrobium parvum]